MTCGSLRNHYGPWDYRVNRGETLDVVERAHFTPKIEMLIRGNTGSIGQDLSYTLRAFPNHHRALLTAERFAQRSSNPQPKDMQYTVDCYYRRAIAFRPDDTVARLLFARYLFSHNDATEARAHLQTAFNQKDATAFSIYNVGLVALEFKEYELAVVAAQRAKGMGMENMTLIERLQAAGKWPGTAAASEPAASSEVSDPRPQ